MNKIRFRGFLNWKKLRQEVADSATFVIITAMPFILLFTGWAIDFTKNVAVLSEYRSIAQEASQAAIRSQDGSGSLLCGQSRADENNPNVVETAHYKFNGYKNAATVMNDFHGMQGKPASFRADRADAVQHAVQAYLEKTGRNYQTTDGDIYTNVEHHAGGAWNQYGLAADGDSGVAAGNDAKFVDAMRSVAGTDAQQRQIDDNNDTTTYDVGLDGKNTDNFSIEVWCTKGVNNSNADKNTSTGQEDTVGSAKKFNTINMEIHDWSGNFVMGMFNSKWAIQRYSIQARAIASWSQSAVN